ncbi:MAG: histidine kinase dimerization/phospho-acceptor domain-containing protein [Balneolaceae bacterium]
MGDLEEIIKENNGLMKDRGHNLQSASHDVGGSMVALKLNLSLLRQTDLNEGATEIVGQISKATDNLSQLLDNMLDLFRLEAGREQLEINEFDR